jgi:sterol desaturase/sphingolipid hydroxylase (fatty acid hydroxylase superfamily)
MSSDMLISSAVIVSVFGAGTATAYVLCKQQNTSFFNPKRENERDYYLYIAAVALFTLTQSIWLTTNVFHPSIENETHTSLVTIANIVNYCIWVEGFYYAYHRFAHTKSAYKWLHSTHHTNVVVYPADTFYFSLLDVTALSVILGAPTLFLRVNWFEHIVVLYVYITSGYLSHSDHFYKHHDLHHRLMNCNYCLFLPIFDMALNTYKEA